MTDASPEPRARLISSARRIFHCRGYATAPLGEIAGDAGMEKGHLTYYFGNKRALLEAVVRTWEIEFRQLIATWDRLGSGPEARLTGFIDMIEAHADTLALSGCPLGTLVGELGKTLPAQSSVALGPVDLLIDWMTACFALVHTPAAARDRAEQLFALAEGASVLAHARHDAKVIRRHARLMRRWLASACRPL